MIEMYEVVVLILSPVQQVADQTGDFGNLYTSGAFNCPHRGQTVDVRSDPTGTLHKVIGVPGITPLKNHLDASEHLSRAPGIDDLTPFDFDFDPHMAFDPGDRIDYDAFTHL
jgi:hypothetical protein